MSKLNEPLRHPQLFLLLRQWTNESDYVKPTHKAVHPSNFVHRRSRRRHGTKRDKASEREQQEVQEMNRRLGEPGKETTTTLAETLNLAATYKNEERWWEAAKLEADSMAIQLRVFGPEHPRTLQTTSNLAITYEKLGEWPKAERLGVHVLEARKRVLGENHPDTIYSMMNLAAVYTSQEEGYHAQQLIHEVAKLKKKKLGNDHPDTLDSMMSLAMLYRRWAPPTHCSEESRDISAAKTLEDKVTKGCKKVLETTKDRDTLSKIAKLAESVANQPSSRVITWGFVDKLGTLIWEKRKMNILKLQTLVMERRMTVLGAEHPDTLNSMLNVAIRYRKAGRSTEAQQLEIQTMKKSIRVLKRTDNPEILSVMAEFARHFAFEAQCVGAEQLMVEVVEAMKIMLGADHPATVKSLASLADINSHLSNLLRGIRKIIT